MFSMALAKKIKVHVQGDHYEPVNIYVVPVAPSGERKSPVCRELLKPIERYEREENERREPEIAAYESRRRIMQKRRDAAEKEAAKARGMERQSAERESEELARSLAELERNAVVPLRMFVGGDCTPEAMTGVMAKQGGRLALIDTEAGIIDILRGRYSGTNEASIDTFLKAYSGDRIRGDRVNKDRVDDIIDPALTACFFAQPEALRGLVAETRLRGRGLLARLWVVMVPSYVGFRKLDPDPVPTELRIGYEFALNKALALEPATAADGSETPHVLKLDPRARDIWLTFAGTVEASMRPDGEMTHISDWANKISGGVARIAGLLHGINYASTGDLAGQPVSAETMRSAVLIGEYLVAHTKAAFWEMGADPDIELARRIVGWVKSDGLSEFTKRDAHQRFKSSVHTADELDGPIRILEEAGYIQDVTKQPGKKGGRPSIRFAVNPAVAVR